MTTPSPPSAPTDATLLLACPDQKGLVATMTKLIYEHGGNILDAQQHADGVEKMFFQRIHFDLAELDVRRDELEDLLRITAGRFDMRWRITYADARKQVAIFCSKAAHCLYDLLLRHELGELRCDIALIISNHEKLRPVAEQFGVRFEHVPITKDTKAEQERHEIEMLREAGVDLVVLARYMQILSGQLIEAFERKIINIHHSFLPAFIGAKPYHQAYARGVKLIGATAHYATEDLDEGPIIDQDVVRSGHRDTTKDLVRKGRDVERQVLARAVRAHLEDRVIVHGRRTVVF